MQNFIQTVDTTAMPYAWKAPESLAHEIALGCGGCVRAALADLESAYDMGAVA